MSCCAMLAGCPSSGKMSTARPQSSETRLRVSCDRWNCATPNKLISFGASLAALRCPSSPSSSSPSSSSFTAASSSSSSSPAPSLSSSSESSSSTEELASSSTFSSSSSAASSMPSSSASSSERAAPSDSSSSPSSREPPSELALRCPLCALPSCEPPASLPWLSVCEFLPEKTLGAGLRDEERCSFDPLPRFSSLAPCEAPPCASPPPSPAGRGMIACHNSLTRPGRNTCDSRTKSTRNTAPCLGPAASKTNSRSADTAPCEEEDIRNKCNSKTPRTAGLMEKPSTWELICKANWPSLSLAWANSASFSAHSRTVTEPAHFK
mmetsp:Transcript_40408/g.129738  ORF Transcript_40408/g.129738 Transcript_40408/m.129738 type:complete len:323 (-) Transcript_40408:2320-3288(-)